MFHFFISSEQVFFSWFVSIVASSDENFTRMLILHSASSKQKWSAPPLNANECTILRMLLSPQSERSRKLSEEENLFEEKKNLYKPERPPSRRGLILHVSRFMDSKVTTFKVEF